ncbi:MAG: hypothetical protein IPF53_22715 [Blastocatellia bacterium]|nr:hypothetical protein [Blastocatellia bacterium]
MIWAAYIAATIADIVTSVIARRNPRLGEGNLLRFTGRFWIVARIALAVAIAVIVLTAPVPLDADRGDRCSSERRGVERGADCEGGLNWQTTFPATGRGL